MKRKTILIILGIVVLAALIAIGISLRKPATAPVEGPQKPAQTETGISETSTEETAETPIEEATGTPAETPAETPSAKTSELSSCALLDEEYCKKGEPIYYHGTYAPQYEGQLVSAGFNLPKGAKIYAPFDGFVGMGGMTGKGKMVMINSSPLKNSETFFIVDVECAIPTEKFTKIEDPETGKKIARAEVKKGELIGIVRGNVVHITTYGSEYIDKKYTVKIDGAKGNAFNGSSYIFDGDLLRRYFNYFK